MTNPWPWLIASLVVLGAGGGAFYWWDQQRRAPAPAAEAPVAQAPQPAEPAASAPPAVQHPIEDAPAAQREQPMPTLPRESDADRVVTDALVGLLGRREVFAFLNSDHFAQRVVATVDNLPRDKATARLWPAQPAGGRFAAQQEGQARVIAASNAARYASFVRFVEGVDAAKAGALYVRLYPLFQQAYEALGYPGRPFNDRLVVVIDHLLATPEPAQPLHLVLTEVKGPLAPARPWVMYEFEDRALESRSAGQKMLLRMGVDNARRLKAKLVEFRGQIARGAPPSR